MKKILITSIFLKYFQIVPIIVFNIPRLMTSFNEKRKVKQKSRKKIKLKTLNEKFRIVASAKHLCSWVTECCRCECLHVGGSACRLLFAVSQLIKIKSFPFEWNWNEFVHKILKTHKHTHMQAAASTSDQRATILNEMEFIKKLYNFPN